MSKCELGGARMMRGARRSSGIHTWSHSLRGGHAPLEKTTLKAAGVQTALEDYVKVKFQAEDLTVTPAQEVMERFEAIGLPAYAILRPGAPVSPSN